MPGRALLGLERPDGCELSRPIDLSLQYDAEHQTGGPPYSRKGAFPARRFSSAETPPGASNHQGTRLRFQAFDDNLGADVEEVPLYKSYQCPDTVGLTGPGRPRPPGSAPAATTQTSSAPSGSGGRLQAILSGGDRQVSDGFGRRASGQVNQTGKTKGYGQASKSEQAVIPVGVKERL